MKTMWKDLTVDLENKPGTLARATEAIAKAGVNIEGLCGYASDGGGLFHFLTQDTQSTRRALESAGFEVKAEKDVAVVEAPDRPGVAAELFRKIADQELNIDLAYLATNTRIVIGGENVPKIQEAISEYAAAARR